MAGFSAITYKLFSGRVSSLLSFGFSRRITPIKGINNELLYLYSVAAPGRRNTKYHHIGRALTRWVIKLRQMIKSRRQVMKQYFGIIIVFAFFLGSCSTLHKTAKQELSDGFYLKECRFCSMLTHCSVLS